MNSENNKLIIKAPSGTKRITLQENEFLKIYLEDFEVGSRDFQLEVVLKGAGSRCAIVGRVQVRRNDKKSWKVKQVVSGKNQAVKIDLHGTAEDSGRLEFDGAAILEQASKNADVDVLEKIWLFDDAQGESLPILTVKTDKVKSASHSASVTPVDESLLFFLEARGIGEKAAKDMLKKGFLGKSKADKKPKTATSPSPPLSFCPIAEPARLQCSENPL